MRLCDHCGGHRPSMPVTTEFWYCEKCYRRAKQRIGHAEVERCPNCSMPGTVKRLHSGEMICLGHHKGGKWKRGPLCDSSWPDGQVPAWTPPPTALNSAARVLKNKGWGGCATRPRGDCGRRNPSSPPTARLGPGHPELGLSGGPRGSPEGGCPRASPSDPDPATGTPGCCPRPPPPGVISPATGPRP